MRARTNRGHTAPFLLGLIATCQRHKVEPLAYLRDALVSIASYRHSRRAAFFVDWSSSSAWCAASSWSLTIADGPCIST